MSAEMDVVLHVGMSKAGSTTLQQEVFPRLEDLNVLGRKHPGEPLDSPLSLAMESLWLVDYRPGELRGLLEERATERRMLVSEEVWTSPLRHETLAHLTRTADRLAAEVPEAKVLLVTRRPADLLVSCYSQYVRTEGGTDSWRKFLQRTDIRTYDVASVCRLYEERFASFHVLLYEDMRNPERFSEVLVGALGSSTRPEEVARWLASRHNIGMSPLFNYAEVAINRAIRTSQFNSPSPRLPFLDEYVRQRLRWANRKFNARSWRVNQRLSARRKRDAELATRTFTYPPQAARPVHSSR